MDPERLESEIFTWLKSKLGVPVEDLTRDTELVSSGLVDSGNLVRLATHLERIAGVRIPDRDIDADHFDSVAMIVEYLQGRTAG